MAAAATAAVAALLLLACLFANSEGALDYQDALSKSILFYESQRSGKLPPNQRVTWRANSALDDGKASGVDLEGGYYDAGDNVKFGLPMAFTVTMLAWSVVDYGTEIAASGELANTLDAIKWGTDYFIKAHPEPNVLWGEVGDGLSDHQCWQRPEDMSTSRQAYRVDQNNPGSDLAGETAAAMAAASMVFRGSQDEYSKLLLSHAKELFTFADTYRGKYDSSIPVVQKFYASRSGYADELLWGAIWLYKATNEQQYLDYVVKNAGVLGGTGWSMTEFSWDVKYAGIQVLAAKVLLDGKAGAHASVLKQYQAKAEYFLCACLQESQGSQVQRTPGGLMYIRQWNNMQYVTSGSFLLTAYSDYLASSKQKITCTGRSVDPSELLNFAKSQVDYILGDNPRATSYIVGYGTNYPRQVHHRAASIVSYKVDSQFVGCKQGYATWFSKSQGDPNVLVGALVGGPDEGDNYADERDNYEQAEPATYNNGPLVGLLARFHIGSKNPTADTLPFTQGGGNGGQSPKPSHRSPAGPSPGAAPAAPTGGHHPRLIRITQSTTSSWHRNGRQFFRYSVVLTNKSKHRTITGLRVNMTGVDGQWGLMKMTEDDLYSLPFSKRLGPRESFTFVYVSSKQASITVTHQKLA